MNDFSSPAPPGWALRLKRGPKAPPGSLAVRLSRDAQRLATYGMAWVAALSLVVTGWLLWQHAEASLRLAGSELRGELAAGLEGLHGGQSEMVRHGRLRQAAQDGPTSDAAAAVSADLNEYLQAHGAVTGIWLVDDSARLVVAQQAANLADSPPELPPLVRSMAQAAMVATRLQTGWRQDGSHRELLLAQPVRFNGSRHIDGALVSAVSIDTLLQPGPQRTDRTGGYRLRRPPGRTGGTAQPPRHGPVAS